MSRESPADARARIDALKPWFHAIDCGNGVRIDRDAVHGGGDYPMSLWRKVQALLPERLDGQRVLDIGCNSGFFCVQTRRLGADYVLGIEAVPFHLEQARLVRELTGADVDLRLLSVYDLTPELGPFDLTLCLGVAYHLRHPLLGLERVAAVTRGRLVVESAVVPDQEIRASGFGGRALTVAYIDNPAEPSGVHHYQNWFVPSPDSLASWLRAVGFSVRSRSVEGDRALLLADRVSP